MSVHCFWADIDTASSEEKFHVDPNLMCISSSLAILMYFSRKIFPCVHNAAYTSQCCLI